MPPLLLPLLLAACGGKPDTSATSDTGDSAPPGCAASPSALAACADEARYTNLLDTVAVTRPPGSDNWQQVQDLCASSFEEAGFSVDRQDYGSGVNVVGTLEGTSGGPPVVLSAHYDSIAACPGADDNASGVAGLLEAARLLGQGRYAAPIQVACWDEEERGLLGSRSWVTTTSTAGGEVAVAFIFEMIGYKSDEPGSQTLPEGSEILFPDEVAELEAEGNKGDFIALVADEHAEDAANELASQAEALGGKGVPLVITDAMSTSGLTGDLRRSDHAPFWDAGWPAMMITDTSEYRYGGYHCHDGDDTVDRLDPSFATTVVAATVAAAATAAGLEGER